MNLLLMVIVCSVAPVLVVWFLASILRGKWYSLNVFEWTPDARVILCIWMLGVLVGWVKIIADVT